MSSIKQILINAGQGPSAVLVEGLDIPKIVEVRQGPAGPNTVSASTKTDLTGILTGDGANVSVTDATSQGTTGSGGKLVLYADLGHVNTYQKVVFNTPIGGGITLQVYRKTDGTVVWRQA